MRSYILAFLCGGATLLALTAVTPAASAADTNAPAAASAAQLETTRDEIAVTRSNLVQTLADLDALRHSDDPQAQFKVFVAQLAVMRERAKLTRERAQAMETKGDAYFSEWESRNVRLTNDGDRAAAEAARLKRKKSYDLIKRYQEQARTNFTPLIDELEQIKALLSGDGSQEKIKEARDLFEEANWHCVTVQRALINMENQLDILIKDTAQPPAPGR
jgi:hypothetical protein